MTTESVPVVAWFTTGDSPHLLASRCTACGTPYFPPVPPESYCRNPSCNDGTFETAELSRHGTVWSYTDAQYQPPPPYVARHEPYQPFALAAVELPEGLVVLGQVADGYGVADLQVGARVELVVEPLYVEEGGERSVWRWKPAADLGEEADQ